MNKHGTRQIKFSGNRWTTLHLNPSSIICARTRKEISNVDLRETLEAYLNPVDLEEDWHYLRSGLGQEVELHADAELVQQQEALHRQYFLSDRSSLGSEALLYMDRSFDGTPLLTSDNIDALEAMSSAQSWQ